MENDELSSSKKSVAAQTSVTDSVDSSIKSISIASKEVSVLHDLISGGVAGSMSVIVGHPFDTIKVRLQTSSSVSMKSSLTGNFGSLFRGMAAPLSTAAMVNAIIFASYGTSSRWWDTYLPHKLDHGHDPWYKSFVCGSFAGFCQAIVICPMEHLKCRLQMTGDSNNIYKGPLQTSKLIFKSHGIPGLFRGWNSTLIREVPAFGAYFSVYDYVKDYVNDYYYSHGERAESHTWIASAFAGGISGSVTWIMIYPIDVIKTRIQTAPIQTPSHELRIIPVGLDLIRQNGWSILFRGLGVTLMRAFPVNGIIFPVYEFTLSHLTNLDS
jgi:solute carrier family 25 (mitochondrial carnitine/acylcarnitine transporter), member 20/29